MFCWALLLTLQVPTSEHAGPQNPGAAITSFGQWLRPAGDVLSFPGRAIDMALTPDGKTAFVKDSGDLLWFDLRTWTQKGRLAIPHGASPIGLAVSANGRSVFVTNAENGLLRYDRSGANWELKKTWTLPGRKGPKDFAFPCGVALSRDERTAYVALSLNNTLAEVKLSTGELRQFPTGIAPFDVKRLGDTICVSDWGGRRPKKGEMTARSAGSDTLVTENGVASSGAVTLLHLGGAPRFEEIAVGTQPSGETCDSKKGILYVANANADTVSVIKVSARGSKTIATISAKPEIKLPFGSMPAGVALSPDGRTLLVPLSGNNALALFDVTKPNRPTAKGCIPTGWYPVAAASADGWYYVANNKGGATRETPADAKGFNSHQTAGALERISAPSLKELRRFTRTVAQMAMARQIFAAQQRAQRANVPPVPIPAELGQPSSIKHVVYVIKENRTYDQFFGDMSKGDGDPKLCEFPGAITPNQHALADQYVLLDNYYCNGVLSADGHSWATEGNNTPYLQRSFGGFNRSYTFGDDPITYSSTGFIWDALVSAGISFRNYGEMDYASLGPNRTAEDVRKAYRERKPQTFLHMIGIEKLRKFSCRSYPGWNLDIPDQVRVDEFLKEFGDYKKKGEFPSFVIVYLPNDHTGGPMGPKFDIADNDLAVGRLVEALSHSPFWKDMAVFINEDDPQAGLDHVDGHRSLCLVVSPFSRSGRVVSDFYNQTSVLRTIEWIFGVGPMNQRDASSPLMRACFQSESDTTPFGALLPQVDLSQVEAPALSGAALRWERVRHSLDLVRHEVSNDQMSLLNRYIWAMTKGFDARYPSEWEGAHGRGLARKGLKLEGSGKDRD